MYKCCKSCVNPRCEYHGKEGPQDFICKQHMRVAQQAEFMPDGSCRMVPMKTEEKSLIFKKILADLAKNASFSPAYHYGNWERPTMNVPPLDKHGYEKPKTVGGKNVMRFINQERFSFEEFTKRIKKSLNYNLYSMSYKSEIDIEEEPQLTERDLFEFEKECEFDSSFSKKLGIELRPHQKILIDEKHVISAVANCKFDACVSFLKTGCFTWELMPRWGYLLDFDFDIEGESYQIRVVESECDGHNFDLVYDEKFDGGCKRSLQLITHGGLHKTRVFVLLWPEEPVFINEVKLSWDKQNKLRFENWQLLEEKL